MERSGEDHGDVGSRTQGKDRAGPAEGPPMGFARLLSIVASDRIAAMRSSPATLSAHNGLDGEIPYESC